MFHAMNPGNSLKSLENMECNATERVKLRETMTCTLNKLSFFYASATTGVPEALCFFGCL